MSAGRALDAALLERDLAQLWRDAGAEATATGVSRAAALNLVVVGRAAEESAEAAARIATALPCRALVVAVGPEGTQLSGHASIHCRQAGAGRQVCCEQVVLHVGSDATGVLPSALLALFLADLPSVLVTDDVSTLEAEWFARLAPHLERAIVDCGEVASGDHRIAALAAWNARGLQVLDLDWCRLDDWREGFASLFDAAPFARELERLERLEIAHVPAARTRALLAAGWIASRLGWRPGRREGLQHFRLRSPNRDVDLALAPLARPGAPDLVRLAARSAGGTDFAVEPDARHPGHLVASVAARGTCPLPWRLALRRPDRDTLIVRQLVRGPHNVAYADALASAAALLELSGAA